MKSQRHFSFSATGHRSMCRKANGAAFVTWGMDLCEDMIQGYESTPGHTRCFCKRCGSALASAHSGVYLGSASVISCHSALDPVGTIRTNIDRDARRADHYHRRRPL